jgi:hypothetical protein
MTCTSHPLLSPAHLTHYYSGEQNMNEMVETCSMLWGNGEVHTGFWWGDPRERDRLKDPGIDGRIILKWIFNTWDRED